MVCASSQVLACSFSLPCFSSLVVCSMTILYTNYFQLTCCSLSYNWSKLLKGPTPLLMLGLIVPCWSFTPSILLKWCWLLKLCKDAWTCISCAAQAEMTCLAWCWSQVTGDKQAASCCWKCCSCYTSCSTRSFFSFFVSTITYYYLPCLWFLP